MRFLDSGVRSGGIQPAAIDGAEPRRGADASRVTNFTLLLRRNEIRRSTTQKTPHVQHVSGEHFPRAKRRSAGMPGQVLSNRCQRPLASTFIARYQDTAQHNDASSLTTGSIMVAACATQSPPPAAGTPPQPGSFSGNVLSVASFQPLPIPLPLQNKSPPVAPSDPNRFETLPPLSESLLSWM